MAAPALSVVVPAYNEDGGHRRDAGIAARDGRGARARAYEILVVDNASGDGTADLVERLGDPPCACCATRENLGKGASLRRGMLEARGRAAPALRRRLRSLAAVARRGWSSWPTRSTWWWARAWRRARTWAAASRSGAGSRAGASGCSAALVLREPTRDLFCGFKLWRAPAAEAVYGATRARGLDVRRRDARDGARARLPDHRDRDPWTDREGSRALDAAGDRARHARAARGAPARAPRGAGARRAGPELPAAEQQA